VFGCGILKGISPLVVWVWPPRRKFFSFYLGVASLKAPLHSFYLDRPPCVRVRYDSYPIIARVSHNPFLLLHCMSFLHSRLPISLLYVASSSLLVFVLDVAFYFGSHFPISGFHLYPYIGVVFPIHIQHLGSLMIALNLLS
jgi:hypothetical protein